MKAPRIAAIAIAIAALALLGCEPEETEPARPERSSDFALDVFRQQTADLPTATSDNLTDRELRELAESICEVAGYADTVEELAVLGVEINEGTGVSNVDAGAVMGAAIATHCPDEGERIGLGR